MRREKWNQIDEDEKNEKKKKKFASLLTNLKGVLLLSGWSFCYKLAE